MTALAWPPKLFQGMVRANVLIEFLFFSLDDRNVRANIKVWLINVFGAGVYFWWSWLAVVITASLARFITLDNNPVATIRS